MASPKAPVPAAPPDAPIPPGVAPVCVVKRFRKDLPGPSPAVNRGEQSTAKGDEPADSKPGTQTSEAVRYELDIVQSSQSLDTLRGSDPVDLGFEKPDGQSTASGSGLCAPVNSPARSHVHVSPSLAAQSGATLRGSEAEDLVHEKPDGQFLNDNVRMGSVPSVQHRDAVRATEAVGAVSSGEAELSCETRHSAPERVGARLVEADDSSFLAGPVERPSRPDELKAPQHAQPCVPRSNHAVTSCLEPVEELGYAAFHTGGVRDAPPFCPGVSEASSSSMPAKDGALHGVDPELDGRRVPPVYVARQQDHLRKEVSPTPSSSDAETVSVPYPEVQLLFNMSQDAHGRPVPAPRSPRTHEIGAEAKIAVSNTGRASPEPIGHPPCGPVASAKQTTCPLLEAPAGTNRALAPHFSRASGLSTKCSSHKGPAVSGTSVQGVPTGAMGDEVRPGPRRVFTGSAGVLDLPRKVPTHGTQRVVTPISSRPVFTGPGSIPRRTECFPKRATTSPCDEEDKASVLESVRGTSEALLPGGRPLPPRPPTPKRKRLEPEGVSRSSDSASSGEGVTLTPENAEAFLARLDARPTCPSGHPLLSFGSPEPNWWCSVCKREFATRRLLWGCRVCDFDICGNCLANQRSGPTISPAPSQEADQDATPSDAKAWPSIKLLRASGFLTGNDMFPDDLRLALDVNGRNLSVLGSSRAPELKGGFRKVYHESCGPRNADILTFSDADKDAGSMNVSGARSGVRGALTSPRL